MNQELRKLVTDEEIDKAWGNANFGSESKRDVIKDALLQLAGDFRTGHTAECILKELGLVGTNISLTKKGKRYLFYAFHPKNNQPSEGKGELYSREDVDKIALGAAKYGFEYRDISQHHGFVPDGNVLQWLQNFITQTPTPAPAEWKTADAEEILKEALGPMRYNLNGPVTNAQLIWAMHEYAHRSLPAAPVEEERAKAIWNAARAASTYFHDAKTARLVGSQDFKYPTFEDYIQSLNK